MAIELSTNDTMALLHGIQLTQADPDGRGAVTMPFKDISKNGHGMLHGAGVFMLADMAAFAGCKGLGVKCVSAQSSVSFLAPGLEGPFKAEAIPLRIGKTLIVFDVYVYDGKGTLIAKAQMTNAVLK